MVSESTESMWDLTRTLGIEWKDCDTPIYVDWINMRLGGDVLSHTSGVNKLGLYQRSQATPIVT